MEKPLSRSLLLSGLFVLGIFFAPHLSAQKNRVPLVYSVENTGAKYAEQKYVPLNLLPNQSNLPNPFLFANGKKEVKNLKQWTQRRAQIAYSIQHYEIDTKPTVSMDDVDARM